MRHLLSLCALVLALCGLALAQGTTPVLNPANNHLYLTTTTPGDLPAARAEAAALGGYLVAVNDAAEDAFLSSNFSGRMWIGLSDEITEGTFLWDSGEPLTYTNWCPGEPNNAGGNENWVERDFVACTGPGQWNDVPLMTLVQPGLIELPFSNNQYQQNQAGATLDLDGVTSNGLTRPASLKCTGASGSLSLSSTNQGAPWEMAIAVAALVRANNGGFTTPGGQILNINPASTIVWWNGGAVPSITGAFANLSLAYVAPATPLTASAQMVVLDGSLADGVAVSQAGQLDVQAGSAAPITLALADDQSIAVSVTGPPLCAFGSIGFYGTGYTELFVHSNGEVLFTQGSNDFSATVAEFNSQMPRCSGMWSDLSPNVAGSVTVTPSSTDVTVSFAGVPEFANNASSNSFDVIFDASGGTTISGYSPDPTHTTSTIVGISNGSAGTPGAAISFLALVGAGIQVSPLASDSVYETFTGGAVPGGWNAANWPFSDGSLFTVN